MPYGVAVVGNYAYVADYNDGLKIIDISSKTNPTLVGSIATSSCLWRRCRWQLCLCCRWTDGLKIIDISSKTNPTLVGSIATSNAHGVAVVGNYAYVADAVWRVKNHRYQQQNKPYSRWKHSDFECLWRRCRWQLCLCCR